MSLFTKPLPNNEGDTIYASHLNTLSNNVATAFEEQADKDANQDSVINNTATDRAAAEQAATDAQTAQGLAEDAEDDCVVQVGLATDQVTLATTQVGLATDQVGLATSQAHLAEDFATGGYSGEPVGGSSEYWARQAASAASDVVGDSVYTTNELVNGFFRYWSNGTARNVSGAGSTLELSDGLWGNTYNVDSTLNTDRVTSDIGYAMNVYAYGGCDVTHTIPQASAKRFVGSRLTMGVLCKNTSPGSGSRNLNLYILIPGGGAILASASVTIPATSDWVLLTATTDDVIPTLSTDLGVSVSFQYGNSTNCDISILGLHFGGSPQQYRIITAVEDSVVQTWY